MGRNPYESAADPWVPVQRRTWRDEWFRPALTRDEKLIWWHLVTNELHRTPFGLLIATPAMLADDMGEGSAAAYQRALGKFAAAGKVRHDPERRLIWLPNRVKIWPPRNKDQALGWLRFLAALAIPPCEIRDELVEAILRRFTPIIKAQILGSKDLEKLIARSVSVAAVDEEKDQTVTKPVGVPSGPPSSTPSRGSGETPQGAASEPLKPGFKEGTTPTPTPIPIETARKRAPARAFAHEFDEEFALYKLLVGKTKGYQDWPDRRDLYYTRRKQGFSRRQLRACIVDVATNPWNLGLETDSEGVPVKRNQDWKNVVLGRHKGKPSKTEERLERFAARLERQGVVGSQVIEFTPLPGWAFRWYPVERGVDVVMIPQAVPNNVARRLTSQEAQQEGWDEIARVGIDERAKRQEEAERRYQEVIEQELRKNGVNMKEATGETPAQTKREGEQAATEVAAAPAGVDKGGRRGEPTHISAVLADLGAQAPGDSRTMERGSDDGKTT